MTIDEYARAIAEAVRRAALSLANDNLGRSHIDTLRLRHLDLDHVIATVPAPDVQAQDYRLPRTMAVIRHALEGPDPADAVAELLAIARESGRLETQAQIDAAVAREREEIVATLEEHGEYYLAGIIEDRARSGAKGGKTFTTITDLGNGLTAVDVWEKR